ncbi:MAG: tetratricopeptide repeat protein [Acidobacteria bacterium]|nr:tetratricopeptide repeat protein [Acidobacteriota bacterium]
MIPRRPWLQLLDPTLFQFRAGLGETFEDRLALARAYNDRSLHNLSLAILEKLLAEDRAHGDAWFERILCEGEFSTHEDLRELHEQLEAVRDEHPQEAIHRRNLGYLRIIQGRLDDAERALRQALDLDPGDARTLELMGLLCLQREQPAEGKGWLLKAASLQPRDPRTLRLLGLACEALADFHGAEAQMVASLDRDPAYYWGWHTLGEFLLKRGNTEEGLRCIHRARSLNMAEPASYFIVSELFSEQGHSEMAQAELHKLLLLAPPQGVFAQAQCMLGEFRRDAGDREGALSYLSLAADTDPDAAAPWSALGDLAREDQRWEEALRCYREALVREPEAADIQVQLGYTLLELGHAEDGERAFLAALESDPGEYSAYLGLSECYRRTGRVEDELAMVRQAMTLAPEDPDVWNAQGVALEIAGRFLEATEAYEHALAIAPAHRKAANNLGFLLEKRMQKGEAGLRERAVDAWKRRLLICHREGQSIKMAMDHLHKLGVAEETLMQWLSTERALPV